MLHGATFNVCDNNGDSPLHWVRIDDAMGGGRAHELDEKRKAKSEMTPEITNTL